MDNHLFTNEANIFSSFAPALNGVKKINLLPEFIPNRMDGGWGEQIDFRAVIIFFR